MLKSLCILFALTITIDESKIRYGSMKAFKEGDRISVVDSKTIYKEIPSYKIIVKENLKEGSAIYQQLMSKATVVYKRALRAYAREGSFVLIVEKGGVSGYATTDGTQGVIRKI